MIALAALRYRNVLADRGGPIARLQHGTTWCRGRRWFQVCAWLKPGLLGAGAEGGLFSSASGSGTHASLMVARFMAISEALERWAHGSASAAPEGPYGFAVDPTSNGMAAFPGLSTRRVRATAAAEAAERAALMWWWEFGTSARLRPTVWPGVSALELAAPPGFVAVIVFARTDGGHFAYGHAAAGDFATACERAIIELGRHEVAVRHRRQLLPRGTAPSLAGLLDRRAWYFSTPDGHARFLAAARASERGDRLPRMEIVFDGAIPGPWSYYTDVWRVACRPPSRRFVEDGDDYFFW